MIDSLKHFINVIADPRWMFPLTVVMVILLFPPVESIARINRKLGLNHLWTKKGGIGIFAGLFLFFAFGVTDVNFRKIVTTPDNVPIVGLIFLTVFFLWFSMTQAYANDARIAAGKPPAEADDAKEKVLVWPDLVYIEFIALILCSVLLILWSIFLKAPLEQAANPTISPNPSKAPWYFLGLQEMLVYFDPWLAGVVFPSVIVLGMMAIPFLDDNKKGSGYFTFKERPFAISVFMFYWLVLWVFLIVVGTFLRGPNWNFFGPFEYWDLHKLVALTNVNLSEWIYMILLHRRLPENLWVREIGGFVVMFVYLFVIPWLLSKTIFKSMYEKLGVFRYTLFIILFLMSIGLPIKMLLRWAFNIKYIIAIPEFFFNI